LNGENDVLSISGDGLNSDRGTKALVMLASALVLSGCVDLPKANPFAETTMTASPAIVAEVNQAEQSPGAYPRLSAIPPVPTDVRPASAWKSAVVSEWALKRNAEATAAQIPFTLSDTEGWAKAKQAQIPADQTTPPPADAKAETEAYAQSLRGRATPPPPPN